MMTMSTKGATKLNMSEAPPPEAWVNNFFSFGGLCPLRRARCPDLRRDYSQRERESNAALPEHVPKKLHDFLDKNLLQHFDLA